MTKSLILSMEIVTVDRAHRCRYNKNHLLEKGDRRLSVRVDRSNHNYCLACARNFLVKDIGRLQALLAKINGTGVKA